MDLPPTGKKRISSLLKKELDALLAQLDHKKRIAFDPVEFPHRYRRKADREVAALIASSLAYGRVDLFKPVLKDLFDKMGSSPADYCASLRISKERKRLAPMGYRFNKPQDIVAFLLLIGKVLKKEGSLEKLFLQNHSSRERNIKEGLTAFVEGLLQGDTSPLYGEKIYPRGLRQLLPSPATGGACKRLNLFLRWMVRKDDVDLGVWSKVSPAQLVIPLDTHIARISTRLGLTGRKAADWKMAEEITEVFRNFDENDPIRYDFALCHHGIAGGCPARLEKKLCEDCVLERVCPSSQ